jgi:hypothetical protein
MKRKLSRIFSSAAVAGTLAVAGVALTPASASAAAASECHAVQSKSFDTIGANLDLHIKLCVHRTSGNYYYASVAVSWEDGGGGLSTGMDLVRVNLRLEHNDADYKTGSANYTTAVNTFTEGDGYGFSTGSYYSTSTGGWTADGNVEWDIDNDGEGGGTWSLTGSPSI